jgi:L-lactate utilization protein LutB
MDDQAVSSWYIEKRLTALSETMKKKGFGAQYAPDSATAKQMVLDQIPEGSSVILTGSQTLEQIGVKPFLLESDKYNVLNPYAPDLDRVEGIAVRKRGLTADVMISSSNAITEDGCLVNVDGQGNRVAGMIFGPDKVVLAMGMNKVVADVPSAFQRLEEVARPMNNIRIELPNPCTQTGFCQDCNTKTRICNYFSIIERCHLPERINIVLIGENVGY